MYTHTCTQSRVYKFMLFHRIRDTIITRVGGGQARWKIIQRFFRLSPRPEPFLSFSVNRRFLLHPFDY